MISNNRIIRKFVGYSTGYGKSALPVDLSSFTYNTVKNDVILKWITAGELNNSGFDIERSAENNSWIKAGYVAGNGTTNELKIYGIRDRDLKSVFIISD
ncbi:MAG: hypothetical protein IPH77_06245 [Ignavibacteria bacterium]|nr:hypothetical protein [Ignavibacteria bacterium]